jgi:hypothetical protein
VLLGASPGELAFVAVLVALVLLAQIAPKIGEALAVRFGGPRLPRLPDGRDPGEPPPAS